PHVTVPRVTSASAIHRLGRPNDRSVRSPRRPTPANVGILWWRDHAAIGSSPSNRRRPQGTAPAVTRGPPPELPATHIAADIPSLPNVYQVPTWGCGGNGAGFCGDVPLEAPRKAGLLVRRSLMRSSARSRNAITNVSSSRVTRILQYGCLEGSH